MRVAGQTPGSRKSRCSAAPGKEVATTPSKTMGDIVGLVPTFSLELDVSMPQAVEEIVELVQSLLQLECRPRSESSGDSTWQSLEDIEVEAQISPQERIEGHPSARAPREIWESCAVFITIRLFTRSCGVICPLSTNSADTSMICSAWIFTRFGRRPTETCENPCAADHRGNRGIRGHWADHTTRARKKVMNTVHVVDAPILRPFAARHGKL